MSVAVPGVLGFRFQVHLTCCRFEGIPALGDYVALRWTPARGPFQCYRLFKKELQAFHVRFRVSG